MEFITKFKNYLLSQKDKPSLVTVKNYLADVKQFINWSEVTNKNPFAPQSITLQTINEFKAEKAHMLSASSLERHISSLRKFFMFLKLNGDISRSPFEQEGNTKQLPDDPWHLREFKNYLYVYNASRLTIKNYLIDVKQFLSWAEEVLGVKHAWHVADKDIFRQIDNRLVEEYKSRLIRQKVFSPSSINRKLSSLRKYLSWAAEQGYLQQPIKLNEQTPPILLHDKVEQDAQLQMTAAAFPAENTSKIPPIRLFQKLGRASTLTFDLLIVSPIALVFKTVEHRTWVAKGKPIFKQVSNVSLPVFTKQAARLHDQITRYRFKPNVSNISKDIYAPLSVSTKYFPWYKKLWFHARYTRPQWYHKYHQLAIVHYFNWAILIIFSAAIGFGMYNSFVQKPGSSLAALPTAGKRILSFQGRLTDANDNPITTPSWIRFIIYNDSTASGSARQWEEVDKVAPDQDGIFSLNLGSNNNGGEAPLCNGGNPPTSPATGACGIPQSLFANNSALWLGVTVEATAELQPREQIATVAYAVNAETLQGLPPITQTGAGTSNVVLALNSSGNLSIGGSTTFQATSGNFTLSGNTLVLNTNPGSNGNITLAPDGLGFVDIQRPLQNNTNYGNIPSAAGALEVDDLMAILATSSGQSALTIDQNGTGPIISASHSGTAEFTLDNTGNGTFNGNVTGQTIYTGGGITYYINNVTSHLNSLTLAGSFAVSGNVASDLIPSAANTYSLGSATNPWLNLYATNIYSNGTALTQLWQENQGVLSPFNITDDLAVGGTATTSAKFQIFGLTGNATTSGNLTFNTTGVIQTTNNQQFTLGGNTTGNIVIAPQNGSGTLIVNGVAQTVGNGGNYTINTTANGNLNLLSSGNGNITLGQNLGNGNIVIQPNAGGQAALIVNKQGPSGDILTASASGNTQFIVNQTGGVSGRIYYDLDNQSFYLDPAATTNSLLVAGTVGISTLNPLFRSGLDIEKDSSGNATLVVANLDISNSGDLFTASNSAGTKFTIANDGSIKNSILPNLNNTYDLGSFSLNRQWNNIYGKNIYSNGVLLSQLWQENQGVLSPFNITDDLAVGGTSTTSAKFQIFGLTGNATTSGNLTFTANGNIQTTSMLPLILGSATTGSIQLSPKGATGLFVNGIGNVGIGTTTHLGNAQLVVNQSNTSGSGDIFTASSSGTTRFTIQNDGTLASTKYTTAGGVFYTDTNGTFNQASNASANTVLHGGSTPTFSAVDLSNDTSGILPLSKGGSGANLTGDQGGIVYFNSNTTLAVLNHTPVTGQCLVSNGTAAPSWATCSTGGAGTNYWQLSAGAISPIYPSVDMLVGSLATSSAKFAVTGIAGNLTPAASVSATVASGGTGTGIVLKGDGTIQSLINSPLTLGGNTTGNIILSPLNGNGNVTINGSALNTTSGSFNLINNTPTTVNFAGAATTLNIGAAAGTTTFRSSGIDDNQATVNLFSTPTSITLGNVATTLSLGSSAGTGTTTINNNAVLGTNTSNTVTFNALVNGTGVNSAVQPVGNGVTDLGSTAHYWGTIYAENVIAPVGGGTSGFWQLTNNVLSPVNFWNDLAVGGNATGSATPFQVFASSYANDAGTIPAGTATISGNLTFTNPSTTINLLNNTGLTIKSSTYGDLGLITIANLTPSGSLTISGNAAINGGTISSTNSIDTLFAGATTLNIAGGTSTTNLKGNLVLGSSSSNTISFTGNVFSDILPSTIGGPYNLGNINQRWGNVYATNLFLPVAGGTGGYWTLSNSVLSPTNNWNDLAVGGTATGSAAFQVFANAYNNGSIIPAGTASTSGNLVFTGSSTKINLLNNDTLGFYNSIGGNAGINTSNPALYLANHGQVALGTTSPLSTFDVRGNLASSPVASFSGQTSAPALVVDNQGTGDFLDINSAGKNIVALTQNGSNGHIALVPGTTDAYDLGSNPSLGGKEWDTLYVRQIISPVGGGISGYWQLTNGVLSPANLTNDLAVGNTATGSAAFQVFATSYNNGSVVPAGTATTSGNLVFTGTTPKVNILNGGGLGFYTSVGGNGGLNTNPNLFLASNGNVGVGTTSPTALLHVQTATSNAVTLRLQADETQASPAQMVIEGNSNTNQQLIIGYNTANNYASIQSVLQGTSDEPLVLNQDGGNVGIHTTTPESLFDVASKGSTYPSDLNLAQSGATNLVTNPSLEGNSSTGWSLSTNQSVSADRALFGSYSLKFSGTNAIEGSFGNCITVSNGVTYTASEYIYRVTGFSGTTGIFVTEYSDNSCTTSTGASSQVNTTVTNAWTRVSTTFTGSTGSIQSVKIRFVTNGNATGTAYADGFQIEQGSSASPYLDGSLGPGYGWTGAPNNSTSVRFGSAAFAYNTINSASGLGAASGGSAPTLQLDQGGTGDIIDASASGTTQLQLTNTGNIISRKFSDLDNQQYFLDPAAASSNTALAVAGRIGIGTTAPSAKLSILDNTGTANAAFNFSGNVSSSYTTSFAMNDTGLSIGHNSSVRDLEFQTNSTARLTILGGGNVGVGTTNPSQLFTLGAANGTTFNIGLENPTTDATHVRWNLSKRSDNLNFWLFGFDGTTFWNPIKTDWTNKYFTLVPDGTGSVGIGTTAPDKTLQVAGTVHISSHDSFFTSNGWGDELEIENANVVHFKKGTSTTAWALGSTTDGLFRIISSTADDNSAAASYPFIIDTSGNVGIGTTSPHDQLEVDGNIFSSTDVGVYHSVTDKSQQEFLGFDSGTSKFMVRTGGAGAPATNGWEVNVAGSVQLSIDSNGNATVHGCINATGGFSSGNCISDQRLKTNVQPLPSDVLNGLLQLQPVSFNWRTDVPLLQQDPVEFDPTVTHYGFIAQQVASALPELAVPNLQDGYMGVDYSLLPFYMLQGMKEQQMEIASNSAQIATHSAILTNLNLNETGDISLTDISSPSADFTIPHYYTIADALDHPISQMGAFVEFVVGNLRAGSIQTQQVLTNSLAIATENVSVAGQSLRDYIISVVKNAGITTGEISQNNQIQTNVISPLASGSAIAVRLDNSRLEIAKDASSSAVASIDNNGNATFSGKLNSQNLAVNGDATIAGTLHANRIEANSIEGLSAIVSTLSAQNVTNVTNIFFATPSAAPIASNTITGSNNSSSSASPVLSSSGTFANIASLSAYFSYVPSLKADTGTFTQGFSSTGSTNLGDTTIDGQLAIGGQLILTNTDLNVLGSDFAIQPLKQGGVTFEGGLIAIDTNGNLTVNGNATFNGNLAVNTLSPIAGHDLHINLPEKSQLKVSNASGSAVFAVNQLGDVVASGTANIAKLNFNLVQPALAVSDIEVIATGSAGTAAIKAHQTEVTIDNPTVTAQSLIYITPVGTDQTPYLERQVSGKSFTVGIPTQQNESVNFNWLIVN